MDLCMCRCKGMCVYSGACSSVCGKVGLHMGMWLYEVVLTSACPSGMSTCVRRHTRNGT